MQTLQAIARDFSPQIRNVISPSIDRLAWPVQDGLEQNQFDRNDTVYVVTHDPDTAEIGGRTRLLATTKPYLLKGVFPQLMNGPPTPEQSEVWSRFTLSNLRSGVQRAPATRPCGPPVLVGGKEGLPAGPKLMRKRFACPSFTLKQQQHIDLASISCQSFH